MKCSKYVIIVVGGASVVPLCLVSEQYRGWRRICVLFHALRLGITWLPAIRLADGYFVVRPVEAYFQDGLSKQDWLQNVPMFVKQQRS